MQKISTANLQPGMVVANSIYTADGLLLLNAGTILTQSFIDRLNKLGLIAIYVKNNLFEDVDIPEVIQEETRQKAVTLVQKSFTDLKKAARINIEQFSQVADCIVDEVIKSRGAMIHLTDIRSHDGYTFAHSVNVCVLSAVTGLSLGYDRNMLKTLALGALLHDTGKALIPLHILNKPGRLTDEEMNIMQKHTELGFELLRKQEREIPLLAAHVAFQHHEKYDGSGYPRGLAGADIHEYARVASIADVYDAVTADRPYRSAMPAHEAYELVTAMSDSQFDPTILSAFSGNVAVYPIGSFVVLNTGEIGVVIDVTPKLPTRPTIKVIIDAAERHLAESYTINLTEQLTVFISEVLTEKDIIRMGLI